MYSLIKAMLAIVIMVFCTNAFAELTREERRWIEEDGRAKAKLSQFHDLVITAATAYPKAEEVVYVHNHNDRYPVGRARLKGYDLSGAQAYLHMVTNLSSYQGQKSYKLSDTTTEISADRIAQDIEAKGIKIQEIGNSTPTIVVAMFANGNLVMKNNQMVDPDANVYLITPKDFIDSKSYQSFTVGDLIVDKAHRKVYGEVMGFNSVTNSVIYWQKENSNTYARAVAIDLDKVELVKLTCERAVSASSETAAVTSDKRINLPGNITVTKM